MNSSTVLRLCLICSLIFFLAEARGFQQPKHETLPNFDKRKPQSQEALQNKKRDAKVRLQKQLPKAQVDFDEITGSAKSVSVRDGFLSGKKGRGRGVSPTIAAKFEDEPHRATKAFLKEHRALFGHGPEVLTDAKINREFVTPHNGLRTVIWQQQHNDIPVFGSSLISHTTRNEELVQISSHILPNVAQAAVTDSRNQRERNGEPGVDAAAAISIAAEDIGDKVKVIDVISLASASGANKQQKFKARPLKGETETHLVWLPMNDQELRLCWQVVFTSATRGEAFKTLVDAQTGEILVRHGLTEYLSDASYRVFTSDSPTPFSPGHFTPLSTQPPTVSRVLVVTNAFSTNASPNGWINDGVNETVGNNVEAHLDLDANDSPDLPRPQGSPYRVFDFPLDLTESPNTYRNASVVQLFFLCNWYHDKLYELGFTEAAGNFQSDNFGRGGFGNDPVQADAQDGEDFNNANFTTYSDGQSGRMQMFLFNGPYPERDGSLDAEIIFHEYTHGLSNRRVGGGAGLSASQSRGMGEGWSDFYGLCLLAESSDDLNANYAAGAYVTFGYDDVQENYYYGIRRYPYSTDMTKNPLTFKDIDPTQASSHPGVPVAFAGSADEVHNQGEVWCSALWEIRANLINKHGFAIGNQLALQLITDGMNLTPANPNFLQARDGIIQADQINNGGANSIELWAGFAKRGIGAFATSPSSSTTIGVVESFLSPDDLSITPISDFISIGPVGGPFIPGVQNFDLVNEGTSTLNWSVSSSPTWLSISKNSGALVPAATETVSVTINSNANSLVMGVYTNTLRFTNQVSGVVHSRAVTLRVGQPDFLTEFFEDADCDLDYQTFTFTPDGSSSFYSVCRQNATSFPTDPTGGTNLNLWDDSSKAVTLSGGVRVKIYGSSNNIFYVGDNGYITLNSSDVTYTPSLSAHFNRPRISALFTDLDPSEGLGQVSWKQLSNRVAVTYSELEQYNAPNSNSFQIEMFFDGAIRITYLRIEALGTGAESRKILAGLSRGTGVSGNYIESEFSSYKFCEVPIALRAFLVENETLAIEFNTEIAATYQIEYSDDLIDWTPVEPAISGTGSVVQWSDDASLPPSTRGARFFRVSTL